jgi:hypothetical protein
MRKFLILAALLLVTAQAHAASGIIAGAIRWDAWYTPSANSLLAQNNLGPAAYQSRAPVHCVPTSTQSINCVGTQATMDAEITAAVSGGIKYWAFNQYAPSSSLTTGWNLYQSSALKNNVNWCWITSLGLLGQTGNFTSQITLLATQMQQINYQKVTIGATANRPVIYLIWTSGEFASNFGSSYTNVNAMFTALRAQVVAAGLGTPYIVVLGGAPTSAAAIVTSASLDAISSYTPTLTVHPPSLYPTFASLSTQAQSFWVSMAATGTPIVPIAITGLFVNPRVTRPSTLNSGQIPYIGLDTLYAISTNAELVTELSAAVTYITGNPSIVPSTLLLIYAWNECDEGGGALTPTIGDPTGSRLAAIKSTIN